MILKALSESLHLNPVSPSQASKKKRLKKSQLTELTKTAQPRPDDLEQSQSLLSWFSGLSISLRLQVLSLHNSLLATFVRQMYIKKLTEGDYEFKLMSNIARQVDQDLLEENFFFRRNNFEGYSYSDTKLYSEKNFEQMLRFKDTEEYLDTITVDPDVARNPASLIEMMRNITNQRVFEVPCRSYWDPACKKWM